ncbi:MAG: hypothetical protein L6Q66_07450, partial [Bacteroidia bacterium]|nr:hypothetical protein [Bacteroidia bacterium]
IMVMAMAMAMVTAMVTAMAMEIRIKLSDEFEFIDGERMHFEIAKECIVNYLAYSKSHACVN